MVTSPPHLVELDRGGAAAICRRHHDVPAPGEGDVGQRHAAPQAAQALAGGEQRPVGLQQGHRHQTADADRQPALHRLTPEQRQRWGELHPGELLPEVGGAGLE